MLRVINVIRELVLCNDMVGRSLVPYYRQLLPVLNIFITKGKHIGDKIDYSQKKGDVAGETHRLLELLEEQGGESAFVNIKFMIPTY